MGIRDRKSLKQEALSRLALVPGDPRKSVLIHTAVSFGIVLVVALINYLLQLKIDTTSGLGGIGLRSLLTTGQSLLQLLQMFLLPFWQIGILYAALRFARSEPVTFRELSAGFYRFGPVLRLKLGQGVLLALAVMPAVFISSSIFLMTPLSKDYMELMTPIIEQAMLTGQMIEPDVATMEAMTQSIMPMMFIVLVVFALIVLPFVYRLRLAEYVIMEGKTRSGLFAMLASWQMTKGEGFSLFRLDLSFWWFHALVALSVVVSYGGQILSALNVALPISADVVSLLFYVGYMLVQLLVYWRFGGYYYTTYATAYEKLSENVPIPKMPQMPQMDA